MDVTYATLSMYYELFGSRLNFFPFGCLIFFYYCIRPGDAELRANELLAKPDLRLILVAWRTLDGNFARWVTLRLMPLLRLAPSVPVLMRINFQVTSDDEKLFKASLAGDVARPLSSVDLSEESFNVTEQKRGHFFQVEGTPEIFSDENMNVEGEISPCSITTSPGSPTSVTTIPLLYLSSNKADEITSSGKWFSWFTQRIETPVCPIYSHKAKARDVIFFVH